MRIFPPLRVSTIRASQADEALFRALCALRRTLVRIQPGVDLEADYASFRSFFRGDSARLTLIRSTRGEIEGYLGWHVRTLSTPEGRVGVIDSDYYFVKPELRGHVALSKVALTCFLHAALHSQSGRVVIVGHGYPASVLSGLRFSERVRFPQDEDLRDWERDAMQHFAERFCGASFDRDRAVIRMRTTPVEGRRVPGSHAARSAFARFERYNPDWLRGFGLPYLIHLSPGSIARGAVGLSSA